MKRILNSTVFCAIGICIFAATATTAKTNSDEQPFEITPTQSIIPNPNLKFKATPTQPVVTAHMPPPKAMPMEPIETVQTTMTGSGRTIEAHNNKRFTGRSALFGFTLGFQNGDHKIRQISVLQNDNAADFTHADSNSDDPFTAQAAWTQSEAFVPGQVIASGGGEFDIPLPAAPYGYTPVLKGFSFRRADNTDANIRTMGVRLRPAAKIVRVNFTDDQGLDTRNIGAGPGRSGGGARENLTGVHNSIEAAMRRVNRGDLANGARQYAVIVQFVWVPNSMIKETKTAESYDGMRWGGDVGRKGVLNGALQGFLFNFNNSDHHLLETAMRVVPSYNIGTSSGPDIYDIRAKYRDNSDHNPRLMIAEYVSLEYQPPGPNYREK